MPRTISKLFRLAVLLLLSTNMACQSEVSIPIPYTAPILATSTASLPAPQPPGKVAPSTILSPTGTPHQAGRSLGNEIPGETPTPDPTIQAYKEDGTLVFNENFDSPFLNPSVWNTRFRWGTTNPPELQEYSPSALTTLSGILRLSADKNLGGEYPYTSGMIASYDRFYFQYGYVEFRAKVPEGKGLWSALWLLAQDPYSAAEIDVMEIIGNETNRVHTTVHYGWSNGDHGVEGSSTYGPDFSKDFHTYAVDWQWDRVTWYIDGQKVYELKDHVPREPLYLVSNLAVGGDWPGAPDKDTVFPANLEIDYIHIYKR